MASESQSADIPVWFNGTQRWMTGVTKRTTCDDVIYALLVSTGLHETESTDTFAIFEKWREVERPLSARTKILKVWSFWGEEQPNVQLSMRSLEDYFLPGESSLYTRSRRRHKKSSRHKERHSTQCRHHNKPEYTECSRFRTLEQLVKLVVSQERKIQDLSDRIQETDSLIDKHEARIHLHRVQQNGTDYVQNSYLNSHSSESSSSSADNTSFTNLDLRELKAIFPECNFEQLEEIARLCDNMVHIERSVGLEQAKIKELAHEVEQLVESSGAVVQLEGEVNTELEESRVQMIRAVATYVTNEYNERELDRKIDLCLAEITAKTEYINEMHRKIYEAEQRVGSTELSERCTNNRNNSNSQRLTSADTSPLLAPHGYNLKTAHHSTRYEASPYPNIAADSNHYLNRNRNLYNVSGQFLRSFQLDKGTLGHHSETECKSSSIGNDLLQNKSSVVNTSFVNREAYSDDTSVATFNREGRSIRKSIKAQHRPLYGRSRSAERSTDASKLNVNSDYGRVIGYENGILSGKSESHTTKTIVDQYGLELSTHKLGLNSRDSFRSKNRIVSNSNSNVIQKSAYKQQNPHKEGNQLKNSGCERGYQQQSEEIGRKMYDDTISIHTVTSYSGSSSRRVEGDSQARSGSQGSPHNYARDLRTSVNKQHTEDRADTQSAGVYTFRGGENRIPGGEDSFFKERSLFEQNISGLPNTGSDSVGNGLYRGAVHTEVRNSPTSNRTVDLAKPERTDFPDSRNGYHNCPVGNNIYVPPHCENVQLQYEVGGVKNMLQLSSSPSGANQTTLANPVGNSQTERQPRIQQATNNILKQPVKENNSLSSVNSCSEYQQYTTRSDSSPRQQHSRLPDTDTVRPVIDDSLRTHHKKFTDAKWSDRNGVCHQYESVNTNSIYSTQRLQDTIFVQDKKLHFRTDATMIHSNTGVTRENIAGSHSLNPVVKSPVTPKTDPSLLSKKDTVETKLNGEVSGGANRGALYHIVSNKMNKAKSGSTVYQHDNDMKGVGSDASPTQHHKKHNSDLNSVNIQKDIPHNNVKNPNNGEHNSNASSFSFHNGEYNNHSSTFNYNTGNQKQSFSGYNKAGYSIAPFVVSNAKNKTRQLSNQPKAAPAVINHQIYDKEANTQINLVKQLSNTPTNLGMNSTGNVQYSSIGFQNSVNHTNGYHTGGYRTGRTNAVSIQEIHENLSTVKSYPHSRGPRGDVNVRTNAVDVRDRTKFEDVNDSNSDTGLSSMHSDETPNIETLV